MFNLKRKLMPVGEKVIQGALSKVVSPQSSHKSYEILSIKMTFSFLQHIIKAKENCLVVY